MRVVESVIKSEGEPRISVQLEQVLAMLLQPGSYQSGQRRSEMTRHELLRRPIDPVPPGRGSVDSTR